MPKIAFNERFERKYKKLISRNPELKERILEKLELLEKDPFAPSLHLHVLSGVLAAYHSITIDYDCRIVLEADFKNGVFILNNIGSHDDVY